MAAFQRTESIVIGTCSIRCSGQGTGGSRWRRSGDGWQITLLSIAGLGSLVFVSWILKQEVGNWSLKEVSVDRSGKCMQVGCRVSVQEWTTGLDNGERKCAGLKTVWLMSSDRCWLLELQRLRPNGQSVGVWCCGCCWHMVKTLILGIFNIYWALTQFLKNNLLCVCVFV